MARFVPITITVGGTQQGAAEVNRLENSFKGLNTAAQSAGSGGLRNSFQATNLMRSEIQSLVSQIPIVGRLFNGLGSDALRFAQQSQQVTQQIKAQKSAYDEFVKLVARVSGGPKGSVLPVNLIGDLEVSSGTLSSLSNKRAAFAQYLKDFQAIEDPAKRAQIAIDQFGVKGAQLIPVLEGMTAAEAATAGETAAVGGSLAAVALPAALALAAIIALVAGFGLAVKGAIELTNHAVETASKLQDLSDKTNFNVETLQGLQVGAIKAGGNLEKLSAGLGIFDKNITQAYESDTKLAKQFRDFNIDVSNNEVALRQVLAALHDMPPGAKQTELAMLAFGKSGKDVVGILKNLDGTLDEQIEKLKQMGFVMSKEDVKAAADFGDKIDLLKLKISAMAARIGLELIPYADKLINKFDELANQAGPKIKTWADQAIESVKNVSAAIRLAGDAGLGYESGAGTGENATLADALFFGKSVAWAADVSGVVTMLTGAYWALDKIGAKLRQNQADAQAGRDKTGDLNFATAGIAGLRSKLADLTASQRDQLKNNLKPLQEMYDSLGDSIAQYANQSEAARTVNKANRTELEKLPPALAAYQEQQDRDAAALRSGIAARSQKIEQLKAEAKAAETAKQANESAANELAGLNERLAQARDQLGQNADITKLATSELNKFNDRVKEGKYAKVTDAAVLDNLKNGYADYGKILKQLNDNKETEKAAAAQQKLADAIENVRNRVAAAQASALPEKDQRLAETHRNLTETVNSIFNLPGVAFKGGRETLDRFVAALQSGKDAGGPGGAFEQFHNLFTPESLVALSKLNQNTAEFVSLIVKAADADQKLAAAQTPLGQAQAENNRLLEEQKNLNDPILMQQRLENELIREGIGLKLRDFDATLSLSRSQQELGDKSVYHATQANAQVAEFLARTKSVTEVVADAKTGVIQTTFDYLDAGLQKANSHLGRMGNLLSQVESDFIKIAATKFFQWLFGGGSQGPGAGSQGGILAGVFGGGPGGTPTFAGGAASLGGGATGGQSLSRQFLNFIRGGGSNSAQYASTAPFLGSLSGLGGDGISAPASLSSPAGILSAIHEGGHAAPSIGSSSIGLKGSLAQFAPFLGAGIGASLGSRFGIGGQIGGGLIGAGAGLVGSSLLGGTALSTIAATLGISAGVLSAATFGIGAAVLVAAILINRSNQRRKNETARAALNNDTYTAITQILNNARAGQYSSASAALADFDKVKSDYFSKISGYDSKTKKIATDVWNDTKNGFEYYRPLIRDAAQKGADAQARQGKLQPEFANGGAVFSQIQSMRHLQFADGGYSGLMPGVYDRRDNQLIAVSGNEVVLTPRQWKPITGYLKAARVPGFADGGAVRTANPASGSGDVVIENLDVHVEMGTEFAGKVVSAGGKTSQGGKAIARAVRVHFS